MAGEYEAGDTYSYVGLEGQTVTWTRWNNGVWHADDGRDALATDDDIRKARAEV